MVATPTTTGPVHEGTPEELAGVRIAGRTVAELTPSLRNGRHRHSLDTLVGYIVRETIRGGSVLINDDGTVGVDLAVITDPHLYARALDIKRRSTGPGYAVVDDVYDCGCRDGH